MTLVVPHLSEMQRILALPVVEPLTAEQREAMSKKYIHVRPYSGRCTCGNRTCTTADKRTHENPFAFPCACGDPTCRNLLPHPKPVRLLPGQADGLHAYQTTGGGFLRIKVGGGKTVTAMLIAHDFLSKNPDGKVLLLIPPSVYAQFWYRDRTWSMDHLAVHTTWVGLGQTTQKNRLVESGRGPGHAFVLPYSCLSTEDTIEVLRKIDADLVIADEGQEIADGDSAKAKRWWAYVDQRKPQPRGVVMTATPTTRTPMDYHKLMRWSLGLNSPLPRPVVDATRWSQALRSRRLTESDATTAELEVLAPLCKWAGQPLTAEGCREAYRKRLTTVPGFVDSGDDSLGIPLEIRNTEAPDPAGLPGGDRLLELIHRLEVDDIGPNGDVLKHGVEKFAAMEELSAGFYNKRYWDETNPLTPAAKAHFAADQEYSALLNQFFKSTRIPRQGLDTPMAVGKWFSTHGMFKGWDRGRELFEAWQKVKGLEVEGMPERLTEPVRVCDYKIRHAIQWALSIKTKPRGGIIWVYHRGMADWLFESLTSVGLQCILKSGGVEWLENDGSERYFCIASIEAHHKGKNLQHHRNQLIFQWPRPADYCEQLLGRVHRQGQSAERLIVHTNLTSDFDFAQRAATLEDTRYDAETIGGERKLLIADWSPPIT